MMKFLTRVFSWWVYPTFGTTFTLWRDGEFVGEDGFGNRYYRSRGGKKHPAIGRERRWVIYAGEQEASKIPPGWHGWMHHRVDTPPSAETYQGFEWEKRHVENLTGTPGAYRPVGSTLRPGDAKPMGDYEAWTPGR